MLHHEDCVSPDDAAGRKLEGYENSAKEINVLVSELPVVKSTSAVAEPVG
jgi:hypothetical protein